MLTLWDVCGKLRVPIPRYIQHTMSTKPAPSPEPYVLKSDLFLLTTAMKVVSRRLDKHYRQKGLCLREVWVIMTASSNNYSQKEVAEIVDINLNVMVRVVDRLEKKGWIVRKRNPTNRREYVLTLTRKSKDFMKWLDENYEEASHQAWYPMNEFELVEMRKRCRRVMTTKGGLD